jgi:hypothetical protein
MTIFWGYIVFSAHEQLPFEYVKVVYECGSFNGHHFRDLMRKIVEIIIIYDIYSSRKLAKQRPTSRPNIAETFQRDFCYRILF